MRHLLLAAGVVLCACGPTSKGAPPSHPPATDDQPKAPQTDEAKAAAIAPGGEQVALTSEDEVALVGTFWPGADASRAVVLVHQLGSDRFEWGPFVPGLLRGASVLAIDMRGHGGSTARTDGSPLAWKEFDGAAWEQIPLDVQAAVEYLRARDPAPESIVLAGSSIGSTAVLLYAVFDAAVARAALLSPGLSYHDLDTATAVEEYGDRALLLVTSKGDETSLAAVDALEKIAGKAVAVRYEGSAHGVKIAADAPELVSTVVEFLLATGD